MRLDGSVFRPCGKGACRDDLAVSSLFSETRGVAMYDIASI